MITLTSRLSGLAVFKKWFFSIFIIIYAYASFFRIDWLVLLLIIGSLSYILEAKQYNRRVLLLSAFTVLFTVYLISNSIFLSNPYQRIVRVIIYGVLIFNYIIHMPDEKIDIVLIGYGIVAIGLLVSINGVIQYMSYGKKYWFQMNPNFLGGFLVTIFPLSIGCIFSSKNRIIKIMNMICSLIIMAAIIMTSCRGSILAVFCSLLFASITLKKYLLVFIYFIYSNFISIISNNIYKNRIVSLLVSNSYDNSILIRFRLWKVGWVIFKKHALFGCGLGNFQTISLKQGIPNIPLLNEQSSEGIHNSYLQIITELGLFGIILFLIMLSSVFIPIAKYLFDENKKYDIWVISFIAGVLAFLVQNVTNSLILVRFESSIAWIMMGLIVYRLRSLKAM